MGGAWGGDTGGGKAEREREEDGRKEGGREEGGREGEQEMEQTVTKRWEGGKIVLGSITIAHELLPW